MGESNFTALQRRVERLEAEGAVRAVITRYMRLCESLDESTPITELGDLFARDAVWAGKGSRYGAEFGEHRGRLAIVEMLGAYRGPPPHFIMNAHFLTSEVIDASTLPITGQWMMLQTSTYANGNAEVRAARLNVQFVPDESRWRIARFETENIFSHSINR